MSTTTVGADRRRAGEISALRLNLLRSLYLVWAVGLAIRVFPRFFPPDIGAPVMDTVVNSVLAGLALTAFLGARYPLRMLPLMLFEMAWKAIWLSAIGLPLWRAGPLGAQAEEVFKAVLFVVFFPLAAPWGYIFDHYVKAPGDRWI